LGALGSQPAAAADRYQIRRGDTLSAIAARVGVSLRRLASANHLADPNLVVAGTWLVVPGATGSAGGNGTGGSGSDDASPSSGSGGTAAGRTHVVAVGETLSAIAGRYGLSTAALAQANGIADPNRVFAGSRLQIPSLEGPSGGSPGSGGSGGSTGSTGSSGSTGSGSSGGSGSSSLPSRLQQHPERLALMPTFDQWAAAYGVPPDLFKAMTYLESGWQQNVVSSTGAVGIGQLMPATVVTVNRLLGTSLRASVASENIRMSARYLDLLLSVTGGDSRAALAGYYQGLASVQHNGLYPSTIAYVNGVEALRIRFR